MMGAVNSAFVSNRFVDYHLWEQSHCVSVTLTSYLAKSKICILTQWATSINWVYRRELVEMVRSCPLITTNEPLVRPEIDRVLTHLTTKKVNQSILSGKRKLTSKRYSYSDESIGFKGLTSFNDNWIGWITTENNKTRLMKKFPERG